MKRFEGPELEAMSERFQLLKRIRLNRQRAMVHFDLFCEKPHIFEGLYFARLRDWHDNPRLLPGYTHPLYIN